MRNPYMQGGDALSNPNDLNAAQPVRYMANGGFIVPPQLPVLYRPEDRSYLEARQAEAEAYDAQRNAYNAALEKYKTEVYNPYESQLNAYNAAAQAYNKDVYEPYQAAYKRYEEAVNAFNAGPMDSEYAGPEAPTLRPFEMQAPVAPRAFEMQAPTLPFKEEEVSARQAQAEKLARQDAASRQFAFEAINDPRQFNLSAMSRGSGIAGLSVPGYMKGGPVIAKPPKVLTSKQMLRKLGNKTKKFEEGGPVGTDRGDARQMLDEVPGYAFGGLIRKLARSVRERMEPQRIERAGVPEQSPVVATQPLSELNSQISALQKRLEGMPQQLSYQRRGPFGIGRRTERYDNPEYMSAQAQLQALLKQRDAMPPSATAPTKPSAPAAPVVPQPTMGTPAPTAPSPVGALPIKEFMPPVAPQPVVKSPTAAPVDPLAKMVLEMAVKRTEPNMMWDANGDGRISAADALQVAKGWRPKDYGQQPAFPKVYPDTFVGPLPKGSVREGDVVAPGPRPVAPQPVAPSPIVPSPITPPSVPGVQPPISRPMVPVPQMPTMPRTPPLFSPPPPGVMPGAMPMPFNPFQINQGPTAQDLLQQNPNLSPTILGGQSNLGFMQDRLGNVIRAPGAVRAFADGGEVDDDEPILTDPVGTANQMLQEMSPQTRTEYEATPKKVSMKRVSRTPMESASGSAKGMKLELDEISAMKMPKDAKRRGSLSKAEFEDLAREYGLKRDAALSSARGLMSETFGKSTLEKPSLTKRGLTKRRFEEGGEVKKSDGAEEESSAPAYGVSPEEQPVLEESSASRALKELIRPVREGVKGYFGMDPESSGSEAYRTGQAMGNMPGIGAPGAIAAGAVGLGSRIIPAARRLLLMPCSDMKCETPTAAKDLYKGVFYQTYNRQVKPGAEPQMMILSAKHGFVTPKQMLEPYNQKMTPQQAEELVNTIKKSLEAVEWPTGIEEVMLVGGKHYQRVMNAAVDELKAQGKIPKEVVVRATKGEIGQQRQQLGEYLRSLPSAEDVPRYSRGGEISGHDAFIAQKMRMGGEAKRTEEESLQSPEEQPVVEESSASRALKELIRPVREGVQGYFGLDSAGAGSEAYRTGQALSNMPGAGAPATLGIFIGKSSKLWNKAMNEAARKMEKSGAPPEEIWRKTGNFKGPDDQWRQEISDLGATQRMQVSQGPVSMVLQHPELYQNYPDMKDILIRTDPYAVRSSYTGAGVPGAEEINLGTAGGKLENIKGLLHEMQHGIQFREGFGLGGSKITAFNDPKAFEILEMVRKRISTPATLEEFAKGAYQTTKITPKIEDAYKNLYLKNYAANLKSGGLDRMAQEEAARIYYNRLLGETEARAVEDRRLFTPEQRLEVFPTKSYKVDGKPVALEDLIIKRPMGRAKGGPVNKHDAFIKAHA